MVSPYLIGEGVAHDERRVSHGAAQVDQAALGQDNDVTAVFQKVAVNLSRGGLQLWRLSQPFGGKAAILALLPGP